MLRIKNVKMTEGPLLSSIIVYAIPIIISGFLQIFFNAADLAIVGNFAAADRATAATAAVGATGAFIALIVQTVMGLSTGVNVTLAKSLGARDRDGSVRIVHTSILLSLLCGIAVGVIGFFVSPFAMDITKCPENAKAMAVDYVRIYFAGCPGIFVYNFGSAILRTKGDTQRPLHFLVIAGITNVILNLFFVIVCHMAASGVALATTISQYLAAFLTIRCLIHQDDETRLLPTRLRIGKRELWNIVRYGVPSGLTNAMYSASNIQIQSAINTFGDSAVAGSAAISSLESFLGAGNSALSASAVAFAGQNLGAKNRKRALKSIVICLLLAMTFGVVLGNGMYAIGSPLYRLYVPNDAVALEIADLRGGIMLTLYFLLAVQSIMGAAIQVYGYPIVSTAISLVGIFGIRTLWMQFLYPHFETLEAIFYCYPVTWTIIALASTVSYLIVYHQYQKRNEL